LKADPVENTPKVDLLKKRIHQIKLNALLEVTKQINNNASVDSLFATYKEIMTTELNLGRIALFVYENGWYCAINHGLEAEVKNLNVAAELIKFKEISEFKFVTGDGKSSFDLVIPVYHKSAPLAYLLIGDMDEQKLEISPIIKHLPFIQTFTNILVVAIENKKLAKEYMRQLSANKELELASKMQTMLFPNVLPDTRYIQVGAYYQPHLQVGGDYYDYIQLNDSEYAFCVADVSGKGVSAALLMANFQANLRAMFKINNTLSDIIYQLNDTVFKNANGEKFITLFLAKYNVHTRVLNYVNAGHNPPLLFTNKTVLPLTTGCMGLGMFDYISQIREGLLHVSYNSILVCYTDGLVEQLNHDKEEFGIENVMKVVDKNRNYDVKHLNGKIMLELDTFKKDVGYVDDIAILTTKFY
jgi:sigma-B regulation protein RsbU (phosphoserine phosphatase)